MNGLINRDVVDSHHVHWTNALSVYQITSMDKGEKKEEFISKEKNQSSVSIKIFSEEVYTALSFDIPDILLQNVSLKLLLPHEFDREILNKSVP